MLQESRWQELIRIKEIFKLIFLVSVTKGTELLMAKIKQGVRKEIFPLDCQKVLI